MKNQYKIGEISRMFHIGLDSLRYYEKLGILVPRRGPENQYRYYGLEEIKNLSLMQELRGLGFSIPAIRHYMENRTLTATTQLLETELSTIDEEVKTLLRVKASIQARLSHIQEAAGRRPMGEIRVKRLPQRRCVLTDLDGCAPQDLNLVTYGLLSMAGFDLYAIGNCDCYYLSMAETGDPGNYLRDKQLFFILDGDSERANHILSAGLYLSLTYRGSLIQTKHYVLDMLDYARAHGLRVLSDPIEMCIIDTFETEDHGEYVTELQLSVEPDGEKEGDTAAPAEFVPKKE